MEAAGRNEAARSQERSGKHSGRLLLRMPEELHAELARASERKGMSLNSFITSTLAAAIGSDAGAPARRTRRQSDAPPAPPRRLVERLLVVNLVVVAAVGVLAVLLLVHALR